MGKFINGSGGNSSSGGLGSGLITLIVVSVVGIISIILLVVLFAGNNQPTVTCNPPVLKQSVEIELDAKAPSKLAYFDQIDENCYPESKIKVDDSQLKTNQLGQYTVKISIDKDKKDVTVVVSDHTPPVLKLKKQVVLRINSNLVDVITPCSCKEFPLNKTSLGLLCNDATTNTRRLRCGTKAKESIILYAQV